MSKVSESGDNSIFASPALELNQYPFESERVDLYDCFFHQTVIIVI